MAYDYRKIFRASLLIIAAGVTLVILSMILKLLSLMLTDTAGQTLTIIGIAFEFLMFPLFLVLYFWAGVRSVEKHKLDAIAAGGVSAVSYLVTGLVSLFLGTILNILVVSRVVSGGGFATAESVLATAILGDTSGATGVGLSALCGLGMIIFGTMINFVVGGIGALFTQYRK
jgi:hypothetical protein